ncbi:gas vesicle protein [Streptomyces sp. HNM0574]|uniref:gas vesicle protein GvpO n=1 Tax=Streptomyces sp. HNM0574 TaxID=2714954 RepID=UPI00146DEBA2|nr:gas vesicle protein [Streptomyces sp. HNM0574]NLU70728.1 gas vesicle protein [Streptomyces sp. HNM0574]
MASSQKQSRQSGTGSRSRAGKPAVRAGEVARIACQSLSELITHRPEAVSAVTRAEDGWRVHVDVLELPRIPDTTSLLATYEVELDEQGELTQYRRVRRFRRGAADE